MTELSRAQMHSYQEEAADFILNQPASALYMDMGLGKTGATLTALQHLLDTFEVRQVLIIAPVRVAKETWPAEIEKWSHTKHLTYQLIAGTPKQREEKLATYTEINIISVDLLPWLVGFFKNRWPYDTVIIDESDAFKSHSSNRFRSLKSVLKYIDRMVQLTGTPTSNGLIDLWPQIYLLDHGERLEKNITRYRNKYFTPGFNGYGWKPQIGAKEKIHAKLNDICFRLDAKDHLVMPECIFKTHSIKLTKEARQQYKRLELDFLLHLEEATVEAANAAVLTGKLLQCCNGALYTDETRKSWEVIHNEKINALKAIMAEYPDEPLLVATQFQSDLVRIKQAIPEAVSVNDGKDVIERWNKGEIRLLAAHPKSIGHGLNLQHGGRHIVWFGLQWSLSLYKQFNARLYRQGQTKPVIIHHLVVEKSVDEQVMQSLSGKEMTQRALLDSLRRSIEINENESIGGVKEKN